MSVSSGSDVTIRVQDSPSSSPPPPPSPYGNRIEQGKMVGENGLDNVGFEPDNNENEKKSGSENHTQKDKKGDHTKIVMNGQDPPLLNEALNSELIKLNIMNTIPDKPQPEFGPYENPDEYFIAVNQHKKFLRSEKLYVTKDKRKGNPWKKYACWFLGAFVLATIVTVAVLAGLGLISQKTTNAFTESVLGTTSSAGLKSSSFNPVSTTSTDSSSFNTDDDWIASASTSTSRTTQDDQFTSPSSVPVRPPLSDNYVPAAADVTLTLRNAEYTAALNNKSSEKFHELATEIEEEMRNLLRNQAGLTTAHAKVMEFLPGSIVVKMRLSWMDQEGKELMDVQMFLSSLRQLNNYDIQAGATSTYGLVNHCKFGNYGCSHHCTFDYEQLDFICTCPEYLLLSEDKKRCVENITLSSSSTEDSRESMSESSETSNSNEQHTDEHSHVHIVTEPSVVVTTENMDHHQHHLATPSTPLVTDAPVEEVPLHPVSITTEASPEPNLNATTVHDTHEEPIQNYPDVQSRGVSTTESEDHSSSVSPSIAIIPIIPETTQHPESVVDTDNVQQQSTPRPSPPLQSPTVEDEVAQTEKIGGVTEEPIVETTLFNLNATAVSDEESSNSNDPLLQRTETDNYSEVEQHQQIVTRINTTTTGAPIISFNSSRYSEENNNTGNLLLSQETSRSDESPPVSTLIEQQHTMERVLGVNSSTETDAEMVPGETPLTSLGVGNGTTRSKSARFESTLFHSQFNNATARRVLANSAEFMLYGDNTVGNSPNQSQGQGTDSGLTEDGEYSFLHQGTMGRFNLDSNETEGAENQSRESNTTGFGNNGSGSVEVVSNESLAPGSSNSSPKEDGESASVGGESDERASIVFSGTHKMSERPREREREEYTTTVPINLENDTLVNENATTEEGSIVEPVVLEDESVATTPPAPTIEETVVQQDQPVGVTESPRIVEDIGSSNNSTVISTTTTTTTTTPPAVVEIEVTEPSVADDLTEVETTMAPPSSPVTPEIVVPDNSNNVTVPQTVNSSDDLTKSPTTPVPVSHNSSSSETTNSNNHLTTIPTTTTTTTIRPSNFVSLNNTNNNHSSSSPADNENELS